MLKRMVIVAVAVAISALTYGVPANADISPPTWTPVSFHVTGHDDLVTEFTTTHSEWDWDFTPTGPGTDDGAGFISGIPLAGTGSVSAHTTLTSQFTSCQVDDYWVGSATPFTATMGILYSNYNLYFAVHLDPYNVEHQTVYSGNTGAPDYCSNDVLTETYVGHVPFTPNGCATIGCTSEWQGSAPLAPNQEAVSGEIVDDRTGPDGGRFESVQYSFKRSICTGVDTDGDGVPDCDELGGGTEPSPQAQITPTSTTCNQFASGADTSLSSLQYSLKNGKINQVNPGVFFYWVQVPAGGTYTITQALSTNTLKRRFSIANGSFAYDVGCAKLNAKPMQDNAGTVTVSFTATGTSYIGIKYNASSLVGELAPSPSTVSYQFATTQVTGSTRGLDLTIKK
jgi:hypothetical protein